MSWATAYTSLQDAIDAAESDTEVWVTSGSYTSVFDDDVDSASFNERQLSFEMKENVDIYGGFDGSETERSERDWETNETILSGEIGDTSDSTDNAFHVVTDISDSTIDGFTISDGYGQLRDQDRTDDDCDATDAMDVDEDREDDELLRVLSDYCYSADAEMINIQAAPTVENVIFEDNYASKAGAIYMDDNASQYGAGTTVSLYDSEFYDNTADLKGAAIAIYNSNTYLKLYSNIFIGNYTNEEVNSINVGYSATLTVSEDEENSFDQIQ